MRRKWVVLVLLPVFVVPAVFTFWVGGGFDKFRSPVDIILPVGYTGIVCVRSVESQHDVPQMRYQVSQNGLLQIEKSVLNSHRRWRLYRKGEDEGGSHLLSSDEWSPIFTENDTATGEIYTLYWIGTSAGWQRYAKAHGQDPYCLGSY